MGKDFISKKQKGNTCVEKGKVNDMKGFITKTLFFVSLAMIVGVAMIGDSTKASAATRKGYTISTVNTRVYSNTGLTNGYGWIYPTDEISVITVTSRYSKVTYPVSSGTKTGYIPTSAILTATNGTTKYATAKITTYRRNSTGNTYGYISSGDTVLVLGTKGSYTQVKYPVSGGYKYAFITTSNANYYLSSSKGGTTTIDPMSTATSFQMPLANAKCTWSGYSNWSWANNSGASGSRVYHLGIDISGSSDSVMATATGTVAKCGWNNANGNYVVLKHTISGKTVYSFYAHLASYSVRAGATVSKGSVIGKVGNTGSSSRGKHLHFAMMNTLWSGSYYGYATYFTGNKTTYGGVTYYNPVYIIQNNRLP